MPTLVHRCPRKSLPTLMLLALLIASPVHAGSSNVSIPVSLDYPLLDHLLAQQLFNTPDGTREIVNDPKECNRIVLNDPRIGAQQADMEIVAGVKAQIGIDLFGSCLNIINWQGRVGFLGRPELQTSARSIKLKPQKTWLINDDGSQILSGWLWDVGNKSLKSFFGDFVLDLAPHLVSLGKFLPEVLPHRDGEQLQEIVNSLTLSNIRVTPEDLNISVNFVVQPLPEQAPAATALSEDELQQLETQWQMMDALLVSAVKHYAGTTQLKALRSKLLEILIESRYRLRDVLTEPAGHNTDAVQAWFIDSWHSLGPVIRRIALEQEGQANMLWFGVLTATDALYALNQLGSSIGLAVSTDGLRRLARMINAGNVDDLLHYSEEVDPGLQEMLREEIESDTTEPSAWRFDFSFFPRAYAAAPGPDLNQWVPRTGELKVYLPKVAKLLENTTKTTLKGRKIEPKHSALYHKLVLATAWQESCWRQYVVKNKKIQPLTSSSGDVGIMQVNERVWRGFYDLQKLRWDIDYNSNAGAEILFDYMVKYALKRGEQKHPGGLNNLARASYSAYNGGPSQVSRYRRTDVAKPHREIDRLFWEKYLQVDAGKALNVAKCLGEELT